MAERLSFNINLKERFIRSGGNKNEKDKYHVTDMQFDVFCPARVCTGYN